MRAALLEADERLTVVDVPMPALSKPNEVLVRVRAVGVCGSEVHAFKGTHPFRKPPVILGHEATGDVVAVGSAVHSFKPNDRVYMDPQWTCGECAYCRSGEVNMCPNRRMLGTIAWPGAFGEYVVVPEDLLFHLPANLSYAEGTIIEPLSIGVHVARRAGVKTGESVAVLGSGSVGSMTAAQCRALGAGPIIVADIKQHCLDASVKRLGASHGFLLPDAGFADKVKALTGGEGVHVTFVVADDPHLVETAVNITRRHGRIVLIALLTGEPLHFYAFPILLKELTVLGSMTGTQQDVIEAIGLAASGRVDVRAILTHILPIEQAQRGMELAATKDDGAIKVALTF